MKPRNYNLADDLITMIDGRLSTYLRRQSQDDLDDYPATKIEEVRLTEGERRESIALMRVNHAGEISAQALYQAQSLTTLDRQLQQTMRSSAEEELAHLAWCKERLRELGGRVSILQPFWFFGSFVIGGLAGLAGKKWSLGFIVETENQVVAHLDEHLRRLPKDARSRSILERMREDESHHASVAYHAGGYELPPLVKRFMRVCSKIMTGTAYWI